MFDSHCHLNLDVFKDELREVINEARENGVGKMLIPAIDETTSKEAIRIANLYNGVYASVGVHPTDDNLETLDPKKLFYVFEELALNEDKVKAVGETGLDYYRYSAAPRIQQDYFIRHIKLTLRTNKALIIHSRQSTEDVLKILKKYWSSELKNKVVLHAAEALETSIKYAEINSVYIGIDGDVTYDSTKMDFIKKVPIELLVLETDSPYLTPKPVRDEKSFPNKPSNLRFVAQKVADIKNIGVDEVSNITTNNAKTLFSLN